MSYTEFYKENNEMVKERYELVMQRIKEIAEENTVDEKYQEFFRENAKNLLLIQQIFDLTQKGELRSLPEERLKEINEALHSKIRDDYDNSYLNPTYMMEKIGEEYGKYLLWLGISTRNLIEAAFAAKKEIIVLYAEVFVEIYNLFETKDFEEKNLKEIIYWFVHDNTEIFVDYNVREMLDPEYDFAKSIVMEADLTKINYLYFYGDHISNNEIATSKLLASFTQEKIDAIAKTYTDGYINGFAAMNKDLSKKETVEMIYNIGFERVVRAAIKQFEAIGLKAVIRGSGYNTTAANRQYGYDHRYSDGIIYDKCIKDRKVDVLKNAFEKYKELGPKMAGPAVIEVFGEKPFEPQDKKEAIKYTEKQFKLFNDFRSENMQIYSQYIRLDERSFTIIAYPVADIGDKYEEIFEATIKINNLDQDLYKNIQTELINALDQGEYVEIFGMNGNRTNLKVALAKLNNPEKETLFENCLADVNIPVGEVFTSPKLEGTEGTLHVTQVYLAGLNYIDLELKFEDGCVREYACKNFEDEKANKDYIKENLLANHETVPMGEFAIGTNTTAYVIGKKYDIIPVMPILIVEKMGPHFAVGDTCYTYQEDDKTYNPDGKEIVAKSNTFADLRKTDPSKAYFNCHTDITIPYNELGAINVVKPDGTRIELIKEGRFVLPGTEKLNEAFQ